MCAQQSVYKWRISAPLFYINIVILHYASVTSHTSKLKRSKQFKTYSRYKTLLITLLQKRKKDNCHITALVSNMGDMPPFSSVIHCGPIKGYKFYVYTC